jgi:ribosomal protein L37AE/L43A
MKDKRTELNMEEPKCQLCNSEMELKEKKKVLDTDYKIYKCKKCHHTVAKSRWGEINVR